MRTLPITNETAVTGMPSADQVRDYPDHAGSRDVYAIARRRLRGPGALVFDARVVLRVHED